MWNCARIALAISAILLGTVAGKASTDTLSDSDLVSRAFAIFASKDSPADRILGVHRGRQVILDVMCSDLCPTYTVRIIHYLAAPDATCVRSGADALDVQVPRGIAAGRESFCVPHTLVAHKLYVDRPYQKAGQ